MGSMNTKSKKTFYVANIIEEGRVGGPQWRMVRVAGELERSFHTVIFMPKTNSDRFQELCTSKHIPFKVTTLTGVTKRWLILAKYSIFFPHEIAILARALKHSSIDLVHVSGGSWQYKGIIAARVVGVPVIWHLNDTEMPALIRIAFRLVQPLASGFIFASERSRQYYSGKLDERPRALIPATVDVDSFNPEHDFEEDTQLNATMGNSWVLGVVANINPVKGLETAILALSALVQKGKDVRLLIVGPVFDTQESYYQQLLALAQTHGIDDRVHWAGARSDTRPLFSLMDVYVCSSRAESSPMSVWEAMAMSVPVVSTNVGDVPIHVLEGESGFIVPVGDHQSMADRVEILLSDESFRKRCGAEARKVAIANFSVKKVAEMTANFYKEVLDASRHRGS